MTKQEMFTKVWLGLAGQNWKRSTEPSADDDHDDPRCCYRGPDGLKCAAGHLIPDEKYERKFEFFNIRNLLEKDPLLLGFEIPANSRNDIVSFLTRMQSAHDLHYVIGFASNANGDREKFQFDNMKDTFAKLAEIHNLQIPEEKS
jgi:hypothetical protein